MKMWKHLIVWSKRIKDTWMFELQLSIISENQWMLGCNINIDFNREFQFSHRTATLEITFIKIYFIMQIYDSLENDE